MVLVSYKLPKEYRTVKTNSASFWLAVVIRLLVWLKYCAASRGLTMIVAEQSTKVLSPHHWTCLATNCSLPARSVGCRDPDDSARYDSERGSGGGHKTAPVRPASPDDPASWTQILELFLNRPTVCHSVASRNLLWLYQSLPISIPYRYALVRRRKDDTGVDTTARGIMALW